MEIIVCIDDNDVPDSRGTGSLASELRELAEERFGAQSGFITRHQLFLHPDIAYTSHNSSMAFPAVIPEDMLTPVFEAFVEHLAKEAAPGSDPGLCVVDKQALRRGERLIEFGYRAKRQVLTQADAYETAEDCGVMLRACGGDGSGVIGALAGAGLRLCGNDGEIKGGLKKYAEDSLVPVSELLAHKRIDSVVTPDGVPADSAGTVYVPWKVKPLLVQGRSVLIVTEEDGPGHYRAYTKEEMRRFGDVRASVEACELFVPDAAEERLSDDFTCFNCAWRRWEADSFSCMKGKR